MQAAATNVDNFNELSSWARERSTEELQGFIERRFSSLTGVEVE